MLLLNMFYATKNAIAMYIYYILLSRGDQDAPVHVTEPKIKWQKWTNFSI